MNMVGNDARPDYYRQSAAAAIAALHSHKMGLTNVEAGRRQADEGANALPKPVRTVFVWSVGNILLRPPAIVSLIAAALAGGLGQAWLALILFAVAGLYTYANYRSRGSGHGTFDPNSFLPIHAKVIRNGQSRSIEAGKLVLGDIVQLQAGDIVPADIRLLQIDDCTTDELVLFGAQGAVDKVSRSVKYGTPLAERHNMAWMGTSVVRGTAAGIVVAIGAQTELGHVTLLASAMQLASSGQRNGQRSFWIYAALLVAALSSLGWLAGVEVTQVLSGLLVLGIGLLPIGIGLAHEGAILQTRRALAERTVHIQKAATLVRLGRCDILFANADLIGELHDTGPHIVGLTDERRATATSSMKLRSLDDTALLTLLMSGHAVFSQLAADEILRLVVVAQQAGHTVAVAGRSLADLPALARADAGVLIIPDGQIVLRQAAPIVVDDEVGLAITIRLSRDLAVRASAIRQFALSGMVAAGLIALASVYGLWFFHVPLALSAPLLLAVQLLFLPLAAFAIHRHDSAHVSSAELLVRAAFLAAVAYSAYLLFFAQQAISPLFIDPASGLARQATTVALAVFVACLWINAASAVGGRITQEMVLAVSISLFTLLNISYNPWFQTMFGSRMLGLIDWAIIVGAGSAYALLVMFLRHTRHHSRHAVMQLHHNTFGKDSPAKV